MLFEINRDEIVITSEDMMEAGYLESLFEGSVRVICESNLIRQGFHITNKRVVRIKLTKAEQNQHKEK